MEVTRAAYAGSTFAGPLLAHGAMLPLRDIAIGCSHPEHGVAVHGGIDEDFITVIPTTDFKERLQSFKKHVYIVRLYFDTPVAALFRQHHFDALVTHVLRPVRPMLACADVEVSQTPTDERKLGLFMRNFSEARTFRLVSNGLGLLPMSVWNNACLNFGKNIYSLEVNPITYLALAQCLV